MIQPYQSFQCPQRTGFDIRLFAKKLINLGLRSDGAVDEQKVKEVFLKLLRAPFFIEKKFPVATLLLIGNTDQNSPLNIIPREVLNLIILDVVNLHVDSYWSLFNTRVMLLSTQLTKMKIEKNKAVKRETGRRLISLKARIRIEVDKLIFGPSILASPPTEKA
jgi:hypothetical protein